MGSVEEKKETGICESASPTNLGMLEAGSKEAVYSNCRTLLRYSWYDGANCSLRIF